MLFALTQDYAETVRNRIQLFRDKTKTTKATQCTFVTTFGIAEGLNNGVIDNEVVAEDLFGGIGVGGMTKNEEKSSPEREAMIHELENMRSGQHTGGRKRKG